MGPAEDDLGGYLKGCKPSVDVERVGELRDSGMGASAIAKEMGIGRASVCTLFLNIPYFTPVSFIATL